MLSRYPWIRIVTPQGVSMTRSLNALIAALCITFVCSGTARAEVGVTDKEILIGNPNVKSGDNLFSGHQTEVGLSTYVSQVNAEGGINGRQVKLVFCDDKYTPDGAVDCFGKLQKDGVFAIAGLVGSGMLAKYKTLAQNNKVPLVGCYSGPQFASDPVARYVFTVRPGYQDEEHQLVEHMWKDAGLKKFAIIYQNDAYGADHLKGIKEALAKHNTEVVAAASYERNTLNVEDAYNTVRAANPQVVSLAANSNQCAKIIEMAKKANWHPLFFVNSGANVDGFLAKVGKDADGVIVGENVPAPGRMDVPLVAKFNKALKQYHPDEKPGFTNLKGYINGMVLCEGLKRAGKDLTREKFVDAMDAIHGWNIGLGKGMEVSYNATDHFGLHKYSFFVVQNGEVTAISDWKALKKNIASGKPSTNKVAAAN
jgi:branched-chain amino acid transport system substrate-binding protein